MGAFLVSTDHLGCIAPAVLFSAALLMHLVDCSSVAIGEMRGLPLYTLGYRQLLTLADLAFTALYVFSTEKAVSHLVLRNLYAFYFVAV